MALFIAILGLSAIVLAQSGDPITWASVILTLHGEKTPSLINGSYNLSPLGANQLLDAGSLIRSRYISPPSNGSNLSSPAPINGISVNKIDNSQLYAMALADEFVSGSAMAFFQGLYPAQGLPTFDFQSTLSNGSNELFPLDGYQYPNIETVSVLDFNYIGIAGNIECDNYGLAREEALASPASLAQTTTYQPFYDSLGRTVFWNIDPAFVSYQYSWFLWEYALYQYNHNQSKPISADNLSQLYNLASQQEFELNSPNSYGTVPSIAGKTFAAVVLDQLHNAINSSGVSDKLTLLFGSYEPFLSFFALSNLSTGPSAGLFDTLPDWGSMMVFELFSNPTNSSDAQNLSSPFPANDDLYVRFLFRNGTGDLAPLIEYPLFGRGNSEDVMSWADFAQGMGEFSINDVIDWCSQCDADTLFCYAIETNIVNSTSPATSSSNKKALSPAVGGVIGATIALAVVIIAVAVLGLCGFRLNFHEKRGKGATALEVGGIGVLKRSGSGKAGGFKGAEKLASDTDLRLKGGAGATVIRHERVGSWELNESPTSPKSASNFDKDVESGRMERVISGADYGRRSEDDHVNPFGDPVKAVDQV